MGFFRINQRTDKTCSISKRVNFDIFSENIKLPKKNNQIIFYEQARLFPYIPGILDISPYNFLDSNLLLKEQNLSGFFQAFSNLLFQDTLGKEFPEYRDT